MAVLSIDSIADFFILRAREIGEAITHLKVQKLVYYAQAWRIALTDMRLVGTRFQAWPHGPVSRELYDRFRKYGWKPIDEDIAEPALPADVVAHLDDVWQTYGSFSALDLERMTHEEDPWKIARGGIAPDAQCDTLISERDMKLYYQKRLADANTPAESP